MAITTKYPSISVIYGFLSVLLHNARMAEEKATDRIQAAIEKYSKDLEAKGIKPPATPDFALFQDCAKYLSSDADKMLLATVAYTLFDKNVAEREKSVKWAKQLYATNKNNYAVFASLADSPLMFAQNLQFIEQISSDAAQAHVDANPLEYMSSISFLKLLGMEVSRKPSVAGIEAAIKKLDPNDMTLDMIDMVEDPAVKTLVKKALMQKPIFARKFLDDELRAKEKNEPYDQSIIEATFGPATGYDPNATGPLELGDSPINLSTLNKYATQIYGAEKAAAIILKEVSRDPLRAIDYVINHYPDDKNSIAVLETALPRINELFEDAQNRTKIALLLNTLDPSAQKDAKGPVLPADKAFKLLDSATAEQLYDFLTEQQINDPKILTDTVGAEVSKRLAEALKREGKTLSDIINSSPERIAKAMSYAIANYPAAADSISFYTAVLPHANGFLNKKETADILISMLNKLEPSQYAGQPHKIIPEKDVFKLLDGANSTQLYDLITQMKNDYMYGMTQGTYNEASKRLYETLKREGKSLSDVANSSPERANMLVEFTKIADIYHRMDGFIKSTTAEDHLLIAQRLFEKAEGESYNISSLATLIKHLPKNSPALAYIESTIITNALKGNEYEKADMGILARWYATQKIHDVSAENKAFFDKVSADKSFEVPPLNKIKSGSLLDAAGRNFQLHAFYNDKDGIDTFNSFSASLRADGYKMKKQDDFIIFSKEQNGKKIEILVSPPEKDGSTIPKILDYVKEKNGVISVISGRGHSHHMAAAVELITPDAKIVALGGCWGHDYTSKVLEKSPDAHILATTGVGRMAINNFNTKWMNDQILSGQDLNWHGLKAGWDRLKTDKTIASDIGQYVSPDENIFLLYERRRNELYEIINKQAEGQAPAAVSELNQTFMQSVRGEVSPKSAPLTVSQVRKDMDVALA